MEEIETCIVDLNTIKTEIEARAKLVGLSRKNVSVRLARIRERMKQYLPENGCGQQMSDEQVAVIGHLSQDTGLKQSTCVRISKTLIVIPQN